MTDQPGRWLPAHVAAIAADAVPHGPIITAADAMPLLPGTDLWDMWPLQQRDGTAASVCGGRLWFILSAPVIGGPNERHFLARIRLMLEGGGVWSDLGLALPADFGPGNREWSGSAIVDDDKSVRLFFTAAGNQGEIGGYRQRLVMTRGTLDVSSDLPRITGWTEPTNCFAPDGQHYRIVDQREGSIGTIKAFRDPGYFRDSADGRSYLLFTGSLATSQSNFDGCIGIARAQDEALTAWELLPPLVNADGVNNELERPHILCRDGQYYLFWSTQNSVFATDGPAGPTGLYAMVAPSVTGPYAPINGTGLVLANPPSEPYQAFSWHVQDDLTVTSFVDSWGMGGRMAQDDGEARAHFGGTPAPLLRIALDGATSRVLATGEAGV
jgi:levansucrase